MPTYPTIKATRALCREVKKTIDDEYRAHEEDEVPGILLTVGTSGETATSWSYQTGDNSFTGGAYHYPHWAVVSVYRDSNCLDLAHEIREQLAELMES
jgi:hypothetical protein